MNLATVLVLLVLAALCVLAVRRIRKKKLLFSCGGDCAHCCADCKSCRASDRQKQKDLPPMT